jgi:hypothetical protein
MALHYHTVMTVNGAQIKARPDFWLAPFMLLIAFMGLAAYVAPGQRYIVYLLIGVLGSLLALVADVGHACAHTVSAKLAKAPMDEIRLSLGMPRTIYFDNDVEPRQHIIRSLGGLTFSALALIASLLWWGLTDPRGLPHLLALISMISNGFILLGGLTPLPIVDGGTILRWLLISRGTAPDRADRVVKTTGLTISGAALVVGVVVLALGSTLLGGVLAGLGALGVVVALGWIG